MAVHTVQELKQLQAMPLSIKIRMTENRIREWVREFGEEGVYVAFSGGKDSTVLLDIVRNRCGYSKVAAVFCDTGLEYPETREFVKGFENVIWLRPELTFKQVIEKYGYPMISKPVAKRVWEYRNAVRAGKDPTKTSAWGEFNGEAMVHNEGFDTPMKSLYNKAKWKFLLDSPFEMSHKCCDWMKKRPFKKIKDKVPITAQMAEESITRQKNWYAHGCNAFEADNPMSNPMSFWTEQDVLRYIKENSLPICSVYGDIVPVSEDGCSDQMSIEDLGIVPDNRKLTTTGCKRTGCMFCGFGCHLDKDQRFVMMKETHPKQYEWIMKPWSEGGLGYKEVIDWLNEHGDVHIEY